MSYNSLFGLGSHSADANLQGWWPLQETTGTTANDESGNNRDGTIAGMGANPTTGTGPNSWLTSAMDFDGTDDYIDVADNVGFTVGDTMTVISRCRADTVTGTHHLVRKGQTGGAALEYLLRISSSEFSCFVENASASLINAKGGTAATATWYNMSLAYDAANIRLRVNKGAIASAAQTGNVRDAGEPFRIGANGADPAAQLFDGLVAEVALFSDDLSTAELDEWEDGPEPVNSVAPSISGTETEGETLTAASGTWGLAAPFTSGSNGTITYAYQWTRSDDDTGTGEADISGATNSTYTLQAADVGKYIRVRVRASNDGGFDSAADTNSLFTGAIAASGGSVVPVLAHHYRQLARR